MSQILRVQDPKSSGDTLKPIRMERLGPACKELRYLLARGYPRRSCVEFIGNHHQLTVQERNILFRGVFPEKQARAIKGVTLALRHLKGYELAIDGYNVTITLENALKGHPIIKGNDGFIRDISGTFRGFRQSILTKKAWGLILDCLKRYRPNHVLVLLDEPYSKSREFAACIQKWLLDEGISGNTMTSKRVDALLIETDKITATSDSTILLKGGRFVDIAGRIATQRLRKKPLVVP